MKTIFAFSHFTCEQVNFCIKFFITINIDINLKYSTRQGVFRVIFVNLDSLNRANNKLVFDNKFNNFSILINHNVKVVFVKNESRCCLDFSNDIFSVRYILEKEYTNLI